MNNQSLEHYYAFLGLGCFLSVAEFYADLNMLN
jgi:hypothetical protein